MNKKTYLILYLILSFFSLKAQNVLISENEESTPASDAILDVQSTKKGMLVPRMNKLQRDEIANPSAGLLIYQTNDDPGFYYFDGTAWTFLKSSGITTESDPQVGNNITNYLSKWDGSKLINSNVIDNGGLIGIGTASPSHMLHINGTARFEKGLDTYGNFWFTDASTYFKSSDNKIVMTHSKTLLNSGYLSLNGPNGKSNIVLTSSNNGYSGYLGLHDGVGDRRLTLSILSGGEGFIETTGSNGNGNVSLTSLSGNSNHGYVAVKDASGATQAGMYVNDSGEGYLFADRVSSQIKNFVEDHPLDPSKEIVYASLEGPEAAMYIRGTNELINGKATVTLPEHFTLLANENSMTVLLTPLSAMSLGLAVTSKSLKSITIEELMNGNGSYRFDWEVKCIRKGYENYQVIRNKDVNRTGILPEMNQLQMVQEPDRPVPSQDNDGEK